jgi:hypothetical protein
MLWTEHGRRRPNWGTTMRQNAAGLRGQIVGGTRAEATVLPDRCYYTCVELKLINGTQLSGMQEEGFAARERRST